MSLIQNIKNLLIKQDAIETKALSSRDYLGRMEPNLVITPAGLQIANDSAAAFLNKDEAQLSATFYTIMNAVQNSVKSIPWNVHQLSNKDENAKKVNDSLLGKIIYRPNPKQSLPEMVAEYVGHFMSTGNAFVYGERVEGGLNAGKPNQLWLMPANTEVVCNNTFMSLPTAYIVDGDTFKPADVLHIKKYNFGNYIYGLSPVQAATIPLTSLRASELQRIKQVTNGGPKFMVYNKDNSDKNIPLTQEQANDFIARLNKPTKFAYNDFELGATQIGLSLVDLQILESIRADASVVADMFGYPAILLGNPNGSTFSNQGEAGKAYWRNCVIPLLDEFKNGLNRFIGDSFGDKLYIDYDLSSVSVLQPDLTALIAAANSADYATVNEKRKMVNLPALVGGEGEGFLLNAGMVYSNKLTELTEAPVDTYAAGDASIIDG